MVRVPDLAIDMRGKEEKINKVAGAMESKAEYMGSMFVYK
jgi:hypothetical protein